MRRALVAAGALLAALVPAGTALADGTAVTPESQYTSPAQSPGIIGGKPATVAAHPYVIVGTREGGPRPQGASCTGSVAAPRKIVIAAHCADAEGKKRFLYGLDNFGDATGGTWLEVVEYKKHPNYTSFQNGWDVAVVTVDRDIPVPAGYRYPRIAGSADTGLVTVGTTTHFAGYGRVALDENYSSELKQADFPIVDPSGCRGFLPSFDERYHLCTGYSDGHDGICQGDSGGGLLVNGVIVGVASFVRTGCNSYGGFGKLAGPMGDWAINEVGQTPTPTCSPVTSGTDVAIPDKGEAVNGELTVSGCAGSATATAKVEVHIVHTWRGDLVIDLLAPDGTAYPLKGSSPGDGAANVDTTYTVNLSAETANGTWRLRIRDVYSFDTGRLDAWTLTP
ncbi:hypothetical protein Afil01_27110 [Actinorhabdospora filicis]|uniref:Secreted trypsin-like serine protease n=1 Tax=Actinorhabdospora filicis TaxID=1785913 RepID=A0A9W6SLG2_9ACTN|nr:hypothetical protein Afil01_27110 [Actinorhabdospora filicis]